MIRQLSLRRPKVNCNGGELKFACVHCMSFAKAPWNVVSPPLMRVHKFSGRTGIGTQFFTSTCVYARAHSVPVGAHTLRTGNSISSLQSRQQSTEMRVCMCVACGLVRKKRHQSTRSCHVYCSEEYSPSLIDSTRHGTRTCAHAICRVYDR